MTSNYPKAIPEALIYAADTLGVDLAQLERVDRKIEKLIKTGEHKFIGLRALRRGQLIFDGQYGTSGMGADEIPLPHDAIYPLASITKTFTATCIAILQEWGEVELWDTVQSWFPEFEGEGKEAVCLWHLLCHTSGIDEDGVSNWIETKLGYPLPGWEEAEKRRDAMLSLRGGLGLSAVGADWSEEQKWEAYEPTEWALWFKAPLTCAPHTAFSYNDAHYELIKLLVERISGVSLEEFAKKYIFEPLGMDDTHWVLPKEKYTRRVIKNPAHKGGEWLNGEEAAKSTGAAGGLKSTLADMLLFGQMFLQGGTLNGKRILSPATVELMTRDMNSELPPSFWFGRMLSASWGLGWDIKNGKKDDLGLLRSDRSYNHGGYGGARLLIDPDYEIVAAFYMCERDNSSVYDNMRNVSDALFAALN